MDWYEATQTQPSQPPAAPPAKPITDFNSPEFLAWVKEVQAMPAEEQVKAVSKKLMELNPGFDGVMCAYNRRGTPKIEDGRVTEIGFYSDNVNDIAPLRALAELKVLFCGGRIQGRSKLTDLSSLQGIPLTMFNCGTTPVTDLSALRGMKLTALFCGNTQISDLMPLNGMPLTTLNAYGTQVSDVSPLENCNGLTSLQIERTRVSSGSVAALQKALPNCKIEWDDPAKATTLQPATSGTK